MAKSMSDGEMDDLFEAAWEFFETGQDQADNLSVEKRKVLEEIATEDLKLTKDIPTLTEIEPSEEPQFEPTSEVLQITSQPDPETQQQTESAFDFLNDDQDDDMFDLAEALNNLPSMTELTEQAHANPSQGDTGQSAFDFMNDTSEAADVPDTAAQLAQARDRLEQAISSNRVEEAARIQQEMVLLAAKAEQGSIVSELGLSPISARYYDRFYRMLDTKGKGKVKGKKLRVLLRRTGLSEVTLIMIWQAADRQQRNYLDRDDFFVALRLIAHAQNNMPVDMDALRNPEYQANQVLPKFQGDNLSKAEAKAAPREEAKTEAKKVVWAMASYCDDCGVKWTLTKRRHHCRMCGRSLCRPCLGKFITQLPGHKGLVKVCKDCVDRNQMSVPAPKIKQAARKVMFANVFTESKDRKALKAERRKAKEQARARKKAEQDRIRTLKQQEKEKQVADKKAEKERRQQEKEEKAARKKRAAALRARMAGRRRGGNSVQPKNMSA